MRQFTIVPLFILICAILMSACSISDDRDERENADADSLFQVSTLAALAAGNYDGLVSFDRILDHGDFGLGTFDALDGELIVLDGVAYRVPADGVPVEVEESVTTPFAAVTPWDSDIVITFDAPLSCTDLQTAIDLQLDSLDTPYAIKVAGEFSAMTTRSENRQEKPYAALAEVLEDQIIFELQDVTATMVGFRLPDYMAGSNATGYHFHALTDDLTAGGHVLDCEASSVVVEVDDIDAWIIEPL